MLATGESSPHLRAPNSSTPQRNSFGVDIQMQMTLRRAAAMEAASSAGSGAGERSSKGRIACAPCAGVEPGCPQAMAPAPGAPLCRTSRARQLRTKAVASWRCTYQKLSKGVVHQLMADSLAKLNASCKSHFDIGDSHSPISLPFYVHLWLTGWQAGWLDSSKAPCEEFTNSTSALERFGHPA